jgi:hypothetical protein
MRLIASARTIRLSFDSGRERFILDTTAHGGALHPLAEQPMTILLDTADIHNIPVLTLAPGEADGCPAIFFVHGFGGSKEAG